MKGSQHSTAVAPEEINLVTPLPVQDYLHSLARTPTPKRFNRQRQLLLDGKSRLPRVRRVLQDASRSTTIETGSSQHDQALIDVVIRAQPPQDAEHCQQLLVNEPDSLTLEQTIRMAGLDLLNPAIDNGREEASKVTDWVYIDAYHLSKQQFITSIEPPLLSGKQQYQHSTSGSSMFINARSMKEDEESRNIKGTSLRHGHRIKASLESSVRFNFGGIQSSSSDPDHDVTHGQRGCILDERDHLPVQSQENLAPSSKWKLRRPGDKQLRTYGNRSPLERHKPARRTRVSRRVAVNELELVLGRFPLNPIQNLDAEATEPGDDPIQNFSSSPFRGPRRTRMRYNTPKVVKKRRPLNELKRNIFKPDTIDFSKYKLPNAYGMTPNTKKRLKTSMTCSDGFEGRESQPTGRTMPMRLPSCHPQITKQTFTRVPELSLTSSRNIIENIENRLRMEEAQPHSDAVTMFYNGEKGIMADAFNPLICQGLELLEDVNKIHRIGGNSHLNDLAKLQPSKRGGVYTEDATVVATPSSAPRLKRRVTFSEDVRVRVIQTLTMVSAPIAIASPCDSDESELGTTDDEDDRTGSTSSDQNGSDDEATGDSDDYYDAEHENSNTEIDVEDEALRPSPESLKATCQRSGSTEEIIQENMQNRAENNKQPAFGDESVRRKNIRSGGTHQRAHSPVSSYAQSPTGKVTALITGEGSHREKVTEDDPWRPRKPVSTRRLIEVDEDILQYPNSLTELLESDNRESFIRSANATRLEVQSFDEYHPYRVRAASKYVEDLQERKQSQAFVELGDPNWSAPYGSKEERIYSQTQNLSYTIADFPHHVVEEYPTYRARVLDSFSNPSQGKSSPVRSMSMPSNHRFHYMDQQIQNDNIVGNLEMRPAFKRIVSPLKRSLSQMQSTDLRVLTRRMSIEAGATPVRRRIQPLSFNPPFLRE